MHMSICKLYVHTCILVCVCVCVCVCAQMHMLYMKAICSYLCIIVCVGVCVWAHKCTCCICKLYVRTCISCVCVHVHTCIPVCRVWGYSCVHIVSGEFCSILNRSLYQNTNPFEQTDSCVNTQIIAFMIAGPHRVLLWCMYSGSTQWHCAVKSVCCWHVHIVNHAQ